MNATDLKKKLARWRGDGAAPSTGFFAWVEDTKPRVPSHKGGYEVFQPDERERAEITRALDSGCGVIVFCWPRRHGKTLVTALIIAWRFLTRPTQNIAIVANSAKQTVDTAFKLVRTIIQQTSYSAALVKAGTIEITGAEIRYPALGSTITGYPANADALYGLKLSIAQCSELHAARDDRVYQTLASGTIDTDDGLMLVDSTTGARSSPLYVLYQIHERAADDNLHFSYIRYKDVEEACASAPRWINAKGLRSRAAQMLPAEFAQQHLNQWTASNNALFPPEIVERCIDTYPLDVAAITDGAAYIVGAGLDRAYGFSLHGDATVTTCVLKTLRGEDEHFYVLASDAIKFSGAHGIKSNLTRYHRDHEMRRTALEAYNVQDIAAWAGDQDFDHEIIHATSERQSNAFTALYNAAAEGRLHVNPAHEKLIGELGSFEYRLEASGTSRGTVPKFEGAKGSHDDHVYSLAWAVYALRYVELNPYEVNGLHCFGTGPVVDLCILNGGNLIPPCTDTCRSFNEVHGLYKRYRGRDHLIPLELAAFVETKVRNIGSHSMPRAA